MSKITKWILSKILTPERIAKMIAKSFVKLITYARLHSTDEAWDKSKEIVKKVEKWCKLFNQVYEDDELTEEEEKIIASEIVNLTDAGTINKILNSFSKNK